MPDAYNPWGAPVFPTADDNAMQPETFVPQGVQDWTRQAAPKDYNILSQIAGSLGKALMYPGQVAQSKEPISTEDMVGPAFNLASMLTLGAGAAPQEANALNMGIKAYHGSPHDFDKFDLSKIGTGEGAQAYGHGLYFADNEGVAKSYRDALSAQQNATQRYQFPGGIDPAYESAAQDFLKNGYSADDTLAGLKKAYKGAREGELEAALNNVRSGGQGRMYEVNINADPSHFLDWDKPLSQQHPVVQDAFGKIVDRNIAEESGWAKLTGKQALRAAAERAGQRGGAETSFNQLGIPGIKYLDQGSRGAGQGSSNYVVFNHDLIDIMRKYAVPGMLGAPILANALSEQKT